MTAAITTLPLTVLDETRLAKFEAIITTGLDTFVAVGTALAEINSQRLYRGTHSTFEAYVQDRFEISRSHAYRTIEAAKIAEIVSPIGDIPNQAQARELGGLPPDLAQQIWSSVMSSKDRTPTAATVRQARHDIAPTQTKLPAAARRRPLPDAFRHASNDLMKVAERLAWLVADDRFKSNATGLSHHRQDLIRARDALQAAIDLLPEPESVVGGDRRGSNPDVRFFTPTITIEVGHRTAVVTSGWPEIRNVLQQLGIASMKDHDTRKMAFPAARADDVQAAMEMRHQQVELRRSDDR